MKLYFSYDPSDHERVTKEMKLYHLLGFDVTNSMDENENDSHFEKNILKEISRSTLVVLAVGKHTFKKNYQSYEAKIAKQFGKQIIVYICEDIDISALKIKLNIPESEYILKKDGINYLLNKIYKIIQKATDYEQKFSLPESTSKIILEKPLRSELIRIESNEDSVNIREDVFDRKRSNKRNRSEIVTWTPYQIGVLLGLLTTVGGISFFLWHYGDKIFSPLHFFYKNSIPIIPSPTILRSELSQNSSQHIDKSEFDKVDCTVFAPQNIKPSNDFFVQVAFHNRQDLEDIRELSSSLDSKNKDMKEIPESLSLEIKKYTSFEVELVIDKKVGVVVDQPNEALTWAGKSFIHKFSLSVHEDATMRVFHAKLYIRNNGQKIGRLYVSLTINSEQKESQIIRHVGTKSKNLLPIFLSYSSKDLWIANLVARTMSSVHKRQIVQDFRVLISGERFEPRLLKEIEECNSFHIIWTHNAKSSKWVEKELQKAIEINNISDDEIPEISVTVMPRRKWLIFGRKSIPQPWDFARNYIHFEDIDKYKF